MVVVASRDLEKIAGKAPGRLEVLSTLLPHDPEVESLGTNGEELTSALHPSAGRVWVGGEWGVWPMGPGPGGLMEAKNAT